MRSQGETNYLLEALDAFPKQMIVVAPDFSLLAAAPPLDEAHGSWLGERCHAVLHRRQSPCDRCAVKACLETGQPALRTKAEYAGEEGSLPCTFAYPIRSGGAIGAVVSLEIDLPTRNEVEEQLQRTNALFRKLILSSLDGVIAADKRGKIFIFNDTAAEVFGYTAAEALESLDIREIYPEGVAYAVMRRLRSQEHGGRGKLRAFPLEVRDKAGRLIPISLNAAIVYDRQQEVATIGFFHDLRERLRIQAELKKTQLQLLQAEKMSSLGKLAAGVAHQLNNPIGGITLFTRLVMEEYDLPPGAREDLQRVLKDAERCRDTIRELLEFTRQTRQFMQPNDINRAIERTLFLLENQALFQNIVIRKRLTASLPAVHSDLQQLNHVFMNIILNAAQAMQGKGTLTVASGLSPEGRHVAITIADSGPGIPEEVLPAIFEPFFTTKEEGQGTGLGLSLAYSIVENHGGTIRAVNPPEGGAAFTVELPIEPPSGQGAKGER